MICTYGQEHSITNEPMSITHRTPPPIRQRGIARKWICLGLSWVFIYIEEKENPLLRSLLYYLSWTSNICSVSTAFWLHFFFNLKANLVLVKDARLTSRVHCSPCRLLPKWAPLQAPLPAAASCRWMISRVRTELADPALRHHQKVPPPGMCSPE